MRTVPIPAAWAPLSIYSGPLRWHLETAMTREMFDALAGWEGTRYGSGQRTRGVRADCIGFVLGAIDDVDGRPRAQCPDLPPDTALHDPATARRAVARLRRLYSPSERVRDGRLQPFDVLVVGPCGGGPGHMMLVGPQRNTLWHCTREAGVHQAGWSLGTGFEVLVAAYRMSDRERWLR